MSSASRKQRKRTTGVDSDWDGNVTLKPEAKGSQKTRAGHSKGRPLKNAAAALSSESEEESKTQDKDKRRTRANTTATTRDQPKRGGKGSGKPQNYADEADDDFNLTQNAGNSKKEMASEGVFFLLIAHGKRTPIKRADVTKAVMKGANFKPTVYKEILQQVQKLLKGAFGIELYGLNESTHQVSLDLGITGLSSYMLVSKFQPIKLVKEFVPSATTEHEEAVQSILFISLSLIYMSDSSIGIKQEVIWRSVSQLGIHDLLDIDERNFTKFLKTEFVQKQYLLPEEVRDDDRGTSTIRYCWGPRAHLEFSKVDILVKMAELFKVRPQNFPKQYKDVMNSPEGARARKVFAKIPHPGLGIVTEEREENEKELDTQPIASGVSLPRISQMHLDGLETDEEGSVLPSQNGSRSGVVMSDEDD